MNEAFLQQEADHLALTPNTSYIHELFDKAEKILLEHRLQNPDLYQMIEAKKIILSKKIDEIKVILTSSLTAPTENETNVPNESIYFKQNCQKQLKNKIAENQRIIHEQIITTQSEIISRTKARNAKQSQDNIEALYFL